jgi:hypothetical protein
MALFAPANSQAGGAIKRRAPRCDRSPRSRAVAQSLAQVAHRPNLDATKNGSGLIASDGNCLV